MFRQNEKQNNVKLYVKRVFITDDCEELIPEYLCFVKGIVDSQDLPLNVSREILQQSVVMRQMKKHIVKKILDKLMELSEDEEKYKEFYEQFSKNIKLGVYHDDRNKDKLSKLLRFHSLKNKEVSISLDKYVEEMKESQKDIYFISAIGKSFEELKNSPFVDTIRRKGCDVLFLMDVIDEYMIQKLNSYGDKKFVDITKEGLKLDDQEKDDDEDKDNNEDYKSLCEHVKSVLGNKVERVVISEREFSSPCILTTGQWGLSANMERITKSQALGGGMSPFMQSRKIMELNKNNNAINLIKTKFEENNDDENVKERIWLLYNAAQLDAGFDLENPFSFTNKIYNMLGSESQSQCDNNCCDNNNDNDNDNNVSPNEDMPTLESETIQDEPQESDQNEPQEAVQVEE